MLKAVQPGPAFIRGRERPDRPAAVWGTNMLDAEVKRFCAECNNGWMSDLESEAQPILGPLILGHSARLTEHDQNVLARWTFKTVLACDFMYADRAEAKSWNTPIPPKTYHDFFESRRPPSPDAIIWMAGYDGDRVAQVARYGRGFSRDKDSPPTTFGYATTLGVGGVVFQVLGWLSGPALFSHPGLHHDAFVAIHPIEPKVFDFPPNSLVLGELGFHNFAERDYF